MESGPNPNILTFQINKKTKGTYNGSSSQTINIDIAQQNVPTGIYNNNIETSAPVNFVKINAGVSTSISETDLKPGQQFTIWVSKTGALNNSLVDNATTFKLSGNRTTDTFMLVVWDAEIKKLRCLLRFDSGSAVIF